jgi:Rrf2 family iron-sulfur cluster assembly transcriptional regulator
VVSKNAVGVPKGRACYCRCDGSRNRPAIGCHRATVLQALVRHGILKGMCGPHGGYALARERNRITADDILRAARAAEDIDELPLPGSTLAHDVIRPALAETERTVSVALGHINIDDMVKRAKTLRFR